MSRIENLIIPVLLIFTLGCSTGSTSEKTEGEENESPISIDPGSFGIDMIEGLPEGLAAGTKAPGFAGRDQNGESFDLYSRLREGPVVLVFYRGKWCPVCNRYMSAFNDSVNYILQKGAQVVAVTPELRSNAKEFASATGTEFPIISDPSNTIMDAFGVTFRVTDSYVDKIEKSKSVNIAENNGSEDSSLPIPATYIIDQTGNINFVHFDLNYRNRASVAEILANL